MVQYSYSPIHERKKKFAYVNKKINKRIASFYNWLWHVVCGIFIGNIFFVKRISSEVFNYVQYVVE